MFLVVNISKYVKSYYAVNWCVSRWNGRDTKDVIIFLISRPGGLTREKVQISRKNYFFLILFSLIYLWNWQIIDISWLKKHYVSQSITKMGFCCKIFKSKSPYHDSDQSTGNPLFTMTTSQRACKPVMTTRAFSRRNLHRAQALCWKSGGRKKIQHVNLAW